MTLESHVLASGAQFDLDFFTTNLFSPQGVLLQGVWATIYLAVISQAIGVLLGLPLALGRRSKSKTLRACCGFYSWLWRGTPLLLQLLIQAEHGATRRPGSRETAGGDAK